jgi:Protein of unknown function (DUF3443)
MTMTGKYRLAGLGALILGAGSLFAEATSTAWASSQPVGVTVTIRGGQGTSGGAQPIVDVRVGGSGPIPVFLDTGSSGLHIFENVVPTGSGSGVTVTSKPANITYSGGQKYNGVVARAVLTLGTQSTTDAVPFAYVKSARCIASKPDCPASGGIEGAEKTGVDGVLGIGMQESKGGVVSPILAMPGTTGTLVLGAPEPASGVATSIAMKSDGTSGTTPLWKDSKLRLCTALGSLYKCTSAVFDSGTYSMQVSGTPLDEAPTTAGSQKVVAGEPVSITVQGAQAPFWTFTTGTSKSLNLVTVRTDKGPYLNTGVQAFYAFTITYDDTTGTISLGDPS